MSDQESANPLPKDNQIDDRLNEILKFYKEYVTGVYQGTANYDEAVTKHAILSALATAIREAIEPKIDYKYIQEDDWKVCNTCDAVIGDGSDYSDKCQCFYKNQTSDKFITNLKVIGLDV